VGLPKRCGLEKTELAGVKGSKLTINRKMKKIPHNKS
jgi:hypothetical protein